MKANLKETALALPGAPDSHAIAVAPRIRRLASAAWNRNWLRKLLLLVLLCGLWELYAGRLNNPLMVPTFSATAQALVDALAGGGLAARVVTSFRILLTGFGIGVVLALLLAVAAVGSRIGADLLELFTAMFNPLPAIALLPLALLWFGLGNGSITFVLVHAVLWPVALNAHAGFAGINNTIRMVGRNYGLSGFRYAFGILLPAALPTLLAGLRNGWAFAWRTLIAAELVFGVSSGSGGIGWFIYENKQQLEIPSVFAGLITVIIIGIAVESLVFDRIERVTVVKWGMNTSGQAQPAPLRS